MRRRAFLGLVGAAALSPLAARAQSKPMPVVGILDPDVTFIFDAFVEGMRDLGYVEGRNIVYVRKVLHGNFAVLPALAAELVDQKVDVVVTVSPPLIHAVERASSTMPIVILASGDPVLAGFVKELRASRRQYHGPVFRRRRIGREAARPVARAGP
jgi:putative tryptophan/tyrosine transport system substrate-binding protein